MREDGDFEARVRKQNYKIIINPNAKTYHDMPYNPREKYFLRVNKLKIYHGIHSKILHEFRYDNMIGKIIFCFSFSVYIAFYSKIILKTDLSLKEKLILFNLLCNGTFKGFRDTIYKRNKIEYVLK